MRFVAKVCVSPKTTQACQRRAELPPCTVAKHRRMRDCRTAVKIYW